MIAELLKSGMSLTRAASRLGISPEHARRLAAKEGVILSDLRRAKRKAIAEFIKQGGTEHKACEQFGVSGTLVRNACREYGVDSARSLNRVSLILTVLGLLKTKNPHAVAKELGICKHKVARIHNMAKDRGLL